MPLLKARKERIPQYDLMRAGAMFLVVYVHSSFLFNFTPAIDSKQAGLYWFTTMLATVCNALFFMVSGKFNLSQATNLKIDGYRIFYTKKAIDLLLPIVIYAIAFWVLRFMANKLFGAWDDGISFWDYGALFKNTQLLLTSSWWFAPLIFSLMIFTPFLGRMLSTLKTKETYVLLALIFGCAAVIGVESLIGSTAVLSKFLAPVFGLTVGVYVLGFVIDKAYMSRKALLRLYILAGSLIVILGLIFVFAPRLALTEGVGPSLKWDSILPAVFFPVIASALFLFFKNIRITGDKTKKVIEFVGNRAFGIYLIHFCFYFSYLHLLPEWLRGADNVVHGLAARVVITTIIFLASLAVAALIDLLVVNPIQKRLKSRFLKI